MDRHGVVFALRQDDRGAIAGDGVQTKQAPPTTGWIETLPRFALEGPRLNSTGYERSGGGVVVAASTGASSIILCLCFGVVGILRFRLQFYRLRLVCIVAVVFLH